MAKTNQDNYRRVGLNNNLIPINERTPEEQAEIHRKAQAAQARTKRERRATRELLDDILYSEIGKKELKERVVGKGLENNELTGLLLQMASKAGNNANMARLIFELKGDLQQQGQVQVNVINQMSDDQIQAELDKLGGGNGCINITPEPPKIE